jgi:hypothetical protein
VGRLSPVQIAWRRRTKAPATVLGMVTTTQQAAGRLLAFLGMTAWLSDYRFWVVLLLAAGIYLCAKGFDRLTDAVQAFHEDYRKVNHMNERDDF